MIRSTLATLDYNRVADAYNTVYTGYFMPFNVDAGWVAQLIERHGVVLTHSPLWLDDDGETIGMAALGVRAEQGWIGGFGIAPAYRGRTLSHGLVQETIEMARAIGLTQLSLEVLTQNDAAIHVYARAGFRHVRDLLILSRTNPEAFLPPRVDVLDTAVGSRLIARRKKIPTVRPAWQRDARGLRSRDGMRALVVGSRYQPRAVGFYIRGDEGVRLLDIAAVDDEAARTLVPALVRLAPDRPLLVVNEPEDNVLLPALLDAGWTEVMRQHEMTIDLV